MFKTLPARTAASPPSGARAPGPEAAGPPAASSSLRTRLSQPIRFITVGIASTLAYALLYLLLRSLIGAFSANALALLLTAVANTAANRRLTFGVRGRDGVVGDHAVGLLAFGAGLVLTSGSLLVLHAVSDPGHVSELIVLMTANVVATLLRFVVLRLRIAGRS
jgi:putative flippase GtrA